MLTDAQRRRLDDRSFVDELAVDAQPIVRLHDEVVVGAETFLRWPDGPTGRVHPLAWIPAAIDIGAYDDVVSATLERVVELCRPELPLGVSVNGVGSSLLDPTVRSHLAAAASNADGPLAVELHHVELDADGGAGFP